jgi:hypothetical protein
LNQKDIWLKWLRKHCPFIPDYCPVLTTQRTAGDLGCNRALNMDSVGAGVMALTGNPRTQEAEAGGSQVQGQPGIHSKT